MWLNKGLPPDPFQETKGPGDSDIPLAEETDLIVLFSTAHLGALSIKVSSRVA